MEIADNNDHGSGGLENKKERYKKGRKQRKKRHKKAMVNRLDNGNGRAQETGKPKTTWLASFLPVHYIYSEVGDGPPRCSGASAHLVHYYGYLIRIQYLQIHTNTNK